MKITNIRVTIFEWPGIADAVDPAHGRKTSRANLALVTVDTDEGLEGHAVMGSSVFPAELDARGVVEILKPVLMGENPMERERLYQEMIRWNRRRMTTLRAIGALDIALWDIAGKAAGLPVHRLLGTYRTRIPAYASSQVLPDIDAYAEEAAMYRQMGWHGYKIHPPRSGAAHDVRLSGRVREAVGDGFALMMDSMWQYGYAEALRVGRALEELEFEWFEDPLPENDAYLYGKLCADLRIPVMATEYPEGGLDMYPTWILSRATDMLRADVAVKGGITPLIKIAHLAEAFDMRLELHHGANSFNNVANLHVSAASRSCGYHEVMLPDRTNKFGLVREIEVDREGYVHAGTLPGIGAQIDFDLVARLTMGTLK